MNKKPYPFLVFSRSYKFFSSTYTTEHSTFAEAYKEMMERNHDFTLILKSDNVFDAYDEFIRQYTEARPKPDEPKE